MIPSAVTIVEIMRAAAAVLACWNACWSFRGARDLARGSFSPPSFYLSVVFLTSMMTISFQLSYAFGVTELWRAFSFSLLIAALLLAAIGHRRGHALKAQQLHHMYDHLDLALAITDLARIDRAAAERLADTARQEIIRAAVIHG